MVSGLCLCPNVLHPVALLPMTIPHAHPAICAQRRQRAAAWRNGLLLMGWLPALCAAQLGPVAKQEIDALLRAVGSSGCEFLRGSQIYSAARAQDHLQEKYAYLDARAQLQSAEDFIVKAATRSSMTGEAYGIRCAGAATLTSEAWLRSRLAALRQPQLPPAQRR